MCIYYVQSVIKQQSFLFRNLLFHYPFAILGVCLSVLLQCFAHLLFNFSTTGF